MGIDQLASRCRGCGKILRQRQSCGVCAEAKRSSLYARGVCSPEAMLVRDADRVMAEQQAEVASAARQERALQAALKRLAPQARVERSPGFSVAWFDRGPQTPLRRPVPAVGEQVDYARALADMQARPEARYQHGFAENVYRWCNGYLVYTMPAFRGVDRVSANSVEANDAYKWQRLPDATTKPKAPEVRAVVDWGTAKADMMARSETVYQLTTDATTRYAYIGGTLMCNPDGAWRASVMSDQTCQMRKWVRVA